MFMPRRDTKARRVQIVAQWRMEKLAEKARTLPVRERVARALAGIGPTQEQMAKDLSETFSDDQIRALAALADVDNPKRRKGGSTEKASRFAVRGRFAAREGCRCGARGCRTQG